MNLLPVARNAEIVVQELGEEILIYDLKTHKAFNLNETSSIIYKACDGTTTFEELKGRHRFTDDLICLALDELKRECLLQENQEYNSPFVGISRREAIKKVGMASMIALPVISSLIAPTAAMAQSITCVSYLGTCTLSTQCCSGAPICSDNKCCVGTGSLSPGDNYIALAGLCPASGPSFCCSGSAFRSASVDALTDICQCN